MTGAAGSDCGARRAGLPGLTLTFTTKETPWTIIGISVSSGGSAA